MIKAFLVAQPKAGTTHMTFSLKRYFGAEYGSVNLWENRGIEVQDIHPQKTHELMVSPKLFVVKPHMQATPNNINTLHHFQIRPIIMTRNILDTVISMRDHFDKDVENRSHKMVPMPLGMPFYHDSYQKLEPVQRTDYIIDHVAPWILMFQYGWQRYQGACLRIDYDDFMSSKPKTFAKVLSFLERKKNIPSRKRLQEVLQHEDLRYNTVVCGRGKRELNPQQIARITAMQARLLG